MRILKKLPKNLKKLPISESLIEALDEMNTLILGRDKISLEISDDGMQDSNGVVIGGLSDKVKKLYDFTYYTPEYDADDDGDGSNSDQVWSIQLTAEEVNRIVNREKTSISLWCCQDEKCVYASYNKDSTCLRCDWYDDGTPEPSHPQYIKM